MYKKGTIAFLYTITPLHSGASTGVGAIDLPIQREVFTHLPVLQASGLKGALRDHFERTLELPPNHKDDRIFTVFGPDTAGASENAGALGVEEARLLLFPVRSLKGIFLYLTCPLVLARLLRDLEVLRSLDFVPLDTARWSDLATESVPLDQVWLGSDNAPAMVTDKLVILEECTYRASGNNAVRELSTWLARWLDAIALNLPARLALVSDDVFLDFCEFSTEVVTRNRIDQISGTVETGGLWVEEHLPRESVLYSLILATKPLRQNNGGLATAEEVLEFVAGKNAPPYLWVGGDQTVGRGLTRMVWKSVQPSVS